MSRISVAHHHDDQNKGSQEGLEYLQQKLTALRGSRSAARNEPAAWRFRLN
jgi:hypothetical protein